MNLRCLILGHIPTFCLTTTEIISFISEDAFRILPGVTRWVECSRCKKLLTQKKTEPYNQDTKLIPGT